MGDLENACEWDGNQEQLRCTVLGQFGVFVYGHLFRPILGINRLNSFYLDRIS